MLSGVISGVIVAGLTSIFILRHLRKADLELLYGGDFPRKILYVDPSGSADATLNLAIRNLNHKSHRDVHLRIFIPTKLNPAIQRSDKSVVTADEVRTPDWVVYECTIKVPIHPRRWLSFGHEIKIRTTAEDGPWKIYYYFSTEDGISPSSAEFVNELDANLELHKLGALDLQRRKL